MRLLRAAILLGMAAPLRAGASPAAGARPVACTLTEDRLARLVEGEAEVQRLLDQAFACGHRLVLVAAPSSGRRAEERFLLELERVPGDAAVPRMRVIGAPAGDERRLTRELNGAGRSGYRLRPDLSVADARPTLPGKLADRWVQILILELDPSGDAWEYWMYEPRLGRSDYFPRRAERRLAAQEARLDAARRAGFAPVGGMRYLLERRVSAAP